MSVLLLPPIFQFFDNNGDPLAGGSVETLAAGTTTRQATYTSAAGTIVAPNPVVLNAAGRPDSGGGAIWGEGAYKFIVRDANGVQVGEVLDNVTSFAGLSAATNAYAELFSGNGVQTVFTTSTDLGTDPKGLLVSVATGLREIAQNGSFTTDTLWTKGAGWTIAAGVATATGAISTAISQAPVLAVLAGQAYAVTYTITRSAGGLIPSIGGQNGTERTASGTYREIIIAAGSTPLAFTGNGFTGTLDDVSVTVATSQPMALLPTSAYTINGTTLTFATAPALGVTNIDVRSPSSLVGAAATSANLAQLYAANALTSQTAAAISASSVAGYAAARNQWTFSTTTTMAAPGTANLRLNNATPASATAIAISNLSANVGNPNLSNWIATWDDAGGSNRGSIFIFKDNGNFAIYNVNSALINGTTWWQVPVTYIAGAGSFSASDAILIGFAASGTTLVSGGITQLTGDVVASGAGSVVATIAANSITTAKILDANVTTAKILDANVTTSKILDANITPAKLSNGGAELGTGRNKVINGAFDVWQGGTSISSGVGANTYTADQWVAIAGGAAITVSKGAGTGYTAGTNALVLTGAASNTTIDIRQRFEAINVQKWKNGNITVSARLYNNTGSTIGANTVIFLVSCPSGTDNWAGSTQRLGTTFAHAAIPTGTWGSLSVTFNPSAYGDIDKGMDIGLRLSNLTTGSVTWSEIQMEQGGVATPFEQRIYQQEFQLCRYFYRTYGRGIQGWASAAAAASCNITFDLPMRTTPAVAFLVSAWSIYRNSGNSSFPSTLTIVDASGDLNGIRLSFTHGGSLTVNEFWASIQSDVISVNARL